MAVAEERALGGEGDGEGGAAGGVGGVEFGDGWVGRLVFVEMTWIGEGGRTPDFFNYAGEHGGPVVRDDSTIRWIEMRL
jgi:hypothetical protein